MPNFAILHWFGLRFEPRFTDMEGQLQELYCADDPALYEKCLIRPAGRIDRDLIISEKPNLDQIVATLGLKEMTQGTLIRKLCTYTAPNPTRRAVFEFDKLIRSIYTLRYLRDPQLERNVHRSQNRIESYHQLRSTIAQVGGKKELTGRTDIEVEISNQCARLIANAVIFYNSATRAGTSSYSAVRRVGSARSVVRSTTRRTATHAFSRATIFSTSASYAPRSSKQREPRRRSA